MCLCSLARYTSHYWHLVPSQHHWITNQQEKVDGFCSFCSVDFLVSHLCKHASVHFCHYYLVIYYITVENQSQNNCLLYKKETPATHKNHRQAKSTQKECNKQPAKVCVTTANGGKKIMTEKQQIAYKLPEPDENTKWKLIVVFYLFINKIMVKCFQLRLNRIWFGFVWTSVVSFIFTNTHRITSYLLHGKSHSRLFTKVLRECTATYCLSDIAHVCVIFNAIFCTSKIIWCAFFHILCLSLSPSLSKHPTMIWFCSYSNLRK